MIHRLLECQDNSLEVKEPIAEALKGFLLSHEDDIGGYINDFENLRPVFKAMFKREPQDGLQ